MYVDIPYLIEMRRKSVWVSYVYGTPTWPRSNFSNNIDVFVGFVRRQLSGGCGRLTSIARQIKQFFSITSLNQVYC